MELSRGELTQVAPIVGMSTCRVMPLGKHKTQRVVVGDSHGELLCFAMKKGAAKTQWKLSLAKDKDGKDGGGSGGGGGGKSGSGDKAGSGGAASGGGAGGGRYPVLAMQLAGDKGDRVFVSQKSGITGVNRKGSVFYGFTPPISDPVTSFAVAGPYLHAASQYSYTLFQESQESFHAMCPGRIQTLLKLPSRGGGAATNPSSRDPILLGCADRTIRLVRGSADFAQQVPVGGIVTALAAQDRGKSSEVYYGLGNGTLGSLRGMLQSSASSSSSSSSSKTAEGKMAAGSDVADTVEESEDDAAAAVQHGWTLGSASASAINCLVTSWDPFQDGTEHMAVARDDGAIQVFAFGFNNDDGGQGAGFGSASPAFSDGVRGSSSSSTRSARPTLRFEEQIGESLRSMDIGQVSAPRFDELVVSTFTGRVCSFTTEAVASIDPSDKYGRSKLQLRNEGLIVETKKEIDSLRKQINKEMAKARGMSKKKSSKMSSKGGDCDGGVASLRLLGGPDGSDLVHQFHVNLDSASASYTCRVELATPVDYVVLVGDIMGAQIDGTDSSCGDVVISLTHSHVLDAQKNSGVNGNQGDGAGGASGITATGTRRALLATVRPAATGTATDQESFGGNTTEKQNNALCSNTKILEWCVRPVEGQHGDINIIVVSSTSEGAVHDVPSSKKGAASPGAISGKVHKRQALELKMNVKPLSLHERVHEEGGDPAEDPSITRAMSSLAIKGRFSAERAHKWLLRMLPGVSPQFNGTSRLEFRNTMIKTILQVSISEGVLEFFSDNISTLAIIKDIISKEAITMNMKLNITSQIHPAGAESIMERLRPMIEAQVRCICCHCLCCCFCRFLDEFLHPLFLTLAHTLFYFFVPAVFLQFALSRDVQLIDAIKEAAGDDLSVNGELAMSYLDPRLIDLLENASTLTKKLKENPKRLEMLFGVVSDLFIDFHLFKGRKLVHLMDKLGALLTNYNHGEVLAFIQNPI